VSEPETPSTPFYVTGGTLKPGAPSYVERRADTELTESLLAGEFCYVLTARQMGKSSLMARTAKRLEQEGVCTAIVDLSQIGTERGGQAAAQWYFGIAHEIHRQLRIAEPLRPWWQERADLPPVQRLTGFFRELVLRHCTGRVVIFVDEIDSTIGLPFADDFFAALRACFNVRATDASFEKLTFALFGVASPDQLIRDQARTPFNIGKRIDLTDFTLEEAAKISGGLHADPVEASKRLDRILYWTGGHPYLTQAVCRIVRERGGNPEAGGIEESVDPWVEDLFLSSRAQREETNLKHTRARLEQPSPEKRRLLRLYLRVRQGKTVPDQLASPLFSQLKLAGVVKATDAGQLAVRNRIYERVFTPEWAKSAMPADRSRQLAAAALVAFLSTLLVWYAFFQPLPYEEVFALAIRDGSPSFAQEAYIELRRNPFTRSRATDLLEEFWEHWALQYSLAGKRDESLLYYLQAIRLKDKESLRRLAANRVGSDYESVRFTLRASSDVTDAAFSPDGSIVFTGSVDNTARLWDAHSGMLIATLVGHQDRVTAVALSPDGSTVLTGSEDKTARLWDAHSGMPIATLGDQQDGVTDVAFSADGRTVLTGSSNGTARLWDAHSAKPIMTSSAVAFRPKAVLSSVMAFSPDGSTVLPISHDGTGTARLWDAYSERPSFSSIPRNYVLVVAFSPDGRTALAGTRDEIAWLWDVRSQKPIVPPLIHHGAVRAAAFSPDGRTVLTGSWDNTAQLWDVRSGRPVAPPLIHQDAVVAVAVSPNGLTVLTGSIDKTARLWSVRSGKPIGSPLIHQGPVFTVAFSPDGRTVLTGSGYGDSRLWNARSGEPITPSFIHQGDNAVAFSPDSRTLLTASWDGTIRLKDARSGKLLAKWEDTTQLKDARRHFVLRPSDVLSVAFNPDGKSFFVATLHWLSSYSWDGKHAVPQNSQLLHGFWRKAFRFPFDCQHCLQVALGDTENSLHIETLHLDTPNDPPIQGDPKELLEKWQRRLGLKFDDQMNLVPRY
jgi:WD40 repeat protein